LETCKNQVLAESQGYPEKSDLEIDRALRAKLDAHYYDIYARTQAEVTKRWTFEGSIKRGYFHVTDVDDAELANWRKYLDFEEAEGDFRRVAFLYERCLVACALYEEFWLRFARWMFAQEKDEDTRNIYMRASCIFVPIAQPTIRLHWARFEEKLGSIHLARDVHLAILEELPDHVDTMISLAGLERRHEGNEAAIQSLENSINQRPGQVGGRLTAEQARILWQCSGKADEARALFHERHEKYLDSQDFWRSYIQFEISQPPVEESHKHIKEVYDLMRNKARISSEIMKDLSQYYLDYLLNRGGEKAAEEYMRLDKELNGYVSSAKVVPSSTPSAPRPL
jgi:pre-mRNA-processing factor 39